MNNLFDTSTKAGPIENIRRPKPEHILAPYGRDLRGRPIMGVCMEGEIYPPTKKHMREPEGNPLDKAFDVENVVWERTIQHISNNKYMNGQVQNVVFFSGTGEREFIKANKGNFIFL